MAEPSVYDLNAPRLRERGYYVHPVGPGTKEPQYTGESSGGDLHKMGIEKGSSVSQM